MDSNSLSRRQILAGTLAAGLGGTLSPSLAMANQDKQAKWEAAVDRGLEFLASKQRRTGGWADDAHPTALTSLAGLAFICNGSTTTQGPWSKPIRLCVDFLIARSRKNGMLGSTSEDRYTYGHGFAMMFLSQVLGEEEDVDRREELVDVLQRAVRFSVNAQTSAGGWGYVSSRVDDFDEGSTTITQVQGLRGCRNAGLLVPKASIEKAKKYIYKCQNKDGGISYSSGSLGDSRPAITAAALAALYNAGDYQSKYIPPMWEYSKKHLHNVRSKAGEGFWYYTYLYYSQVVYRQGPAVWKPFKQQLYKLILKNQEADGSWEDDSYGKVYASSMNLIMLQLDYGYLPIFQR